MIPMLIRRVVAEVGGLLGATQISFATRIACFSLTEDRPASDFESSINHKRKDTAATKFIRPTLEFLHVSP